MPTSIDARVRAGGVPGQERSGASRRGRVLIPRPTASRPAYSPRVPVPDFQTLMRPVLELLADGDDHAVKAIQQALMERFSLSREDAEQMLPGGTGKLFANRVGWATTYLYQTKLIDRPRRAVYGITDRGRQVLAENPDRVDLKLLAQFEELHEFRQGKKRPGGGGEVTVTTNGDERTPEEQID